MVVVILDSCYCDEDVYQDVLEQSDFVNEILSNEPDTDVEIL